MIGQNKRAEIRLHAKLVAHHLEVFTMRICFVHGKESGPQGRKISRLSQVAESLGHETLAPDFTDSFDPEVRLAKLLSLLEDQQPPDSLVGSSMGGYVATAASEVLRPVGLFLMAPALGMPGYARQDIQPYAEKTVIVQGWQDDVVPVANVLQFAQRARADLHVFNAGHTLTEKLGESEVLFAGFLKGLV